MYIHNITSYMIFPKYPLYIVESGDTWATFYKNVDYS